MGPSLSHMSGLHQHLVKFGAARRLRECDANSREQGGIGDALFT